MIEHNLAQADQTLEANTNRETCFNALCWHEFKQCEGLLKLLSNGRAQERDFELWCMELKCTTNRFQEAKEAAAALLPLICHHFHPCDLIQCSGKHVSSRKCCKHSDATVSQRPVPRYGRMTRHVNRCTCVRLCSVATLLELVACVDLLCLEPELRRLDSKFECFRVNGDLLLVAF